MMQITFHFNNLARVRHCLAACQRHTPSSLAAVIGLSNLRHFVTFFTLRASFRQFVRALRWLETPLNYKYFGAFVRQTSRWQEWSAKLSNVETNTCTRNNFCILFRPTLACVCP